MISSDKRDCGKRSCHQIDLAKFLVVPHNFLLQNLNFHISSESREILDKLDNNMAPVKANAIGIILQIIDDCELSKLLRHLNSIQVMSGEDVAVDEIDRLVSVLEQHPKWTFEEQVSSMVVMWVRMSSEPCCKHFSNAIAITIRWTCTNGFLLSTQLMPPFPITFKGTQISCWCLLWSEKTRLLLALLQRRLVPCVRNLYRTQNLFQIMWFNHFARFCNSSPLYFRIRSTNLSSIQ